MAAGVSASLIWGSAFLVPVLLGGWNPVIVTLGRYLVYGLLSAILFTLGGGGPRRGCGSTGAPRWPLPWPATPRTTFCW